MRLPSSRRGLPFWRGIGRLTLVSIAIRDRRCISIDAPHISFLLVRDPWKRVKPFWHRKGPGGGLDGSDLHRNGRLGYSLCLLGPRECQQSHSHLLQFKCFGDFSVRDGIPSTSDSWVGNVWTPGSGSAYLHAPSQNFPTRAWKQYIGISILLLLYIVEAHINYCNNIVEKKYCNTWKL